VYISNTALSSVSSTAAAGAPGIATGHGGGGHLAAQVRTPEDLKAAVARGVQDILITAHMDLTVLDAVRTSVCPDGCESPLGEVNTTRSIRVRTEDM
jgi:hypothetical protein